MLVRICSLLVFLVALPAFSQVEPSAEGGPIAPVDETQMMTPPPVSGMMYPNISGTDATNNFVSVTLSGNAAYIDNVLPESTATPVSDYTYTVSPEFLYNRSTPRQQVTLSYIPSFAFYEPTTQLNAVNQNSVLTFQDRLTEHVALSVQNTFSRTSDVFNGPYPFASGGLSGSPTSPVEAVIAPFAEQMTDAATGAVTYQFGPNAMIGGGGSFSTYSFPASVQSAGLYDSNGGGGSAFYSRRFARTQYIGVTYDYSRFVSSPVNTQIVSQTHSVLPFYTFYFSRSFSVSLSGGVQGVMLAQTQQPDHTSWNPVGVISLGWQGSHGNVAISYLHLVTNGGGLIGAYGSNNVNATAGWKLTRTWNANAAIAYNDVNVIIPFVGYPYQGGDSLMASGSVQHTMGSHFSFELGYDRLHEHYLGITVVSASPDANREFGQIKYEFRKPIGR